MEDALLVFILLNLADISTTRRALRLGATEANPVARYFIGKKGGTGLYVLKLLGFGLIGLFVFLGKLDEAVLWVYNFFYALVVAWNSILLYRLSRLGSAS